MEILFKFEYGKVRGGRKWSRKKEKIRVRSNGSLVQTSEPESELLMWIAVERICFLIVG
jgi:hypothetical protein